MVDIPWVESSHWNGHVLRAGRKQHGSELLVRMKINVNE